MEETTRYILSKTLIAYSHDFIEFQKLETAYALEYHKTGMKKYRIESKRCRKLKEEVYDKMMSTADTLDFIHEIVDKEVIRSKMYKK